MKYIAISGTVGAGKTTLMKRLAAALGERAAFHEERPDENPYIRDYYSDSRRWSFHSQITFLSQYFDDFLPPTADREFYIYDRSILENLLIARYRFEQGDLTEDEYRIIRKLAEGIESLMPPVDQYIYLDCPPLIVEDHMMHRGRDYEEDLDLFYVFEVKRLYDEWAACLPPEKTLRIDMEHEYDVHDILRFIGAE